MDAYVLLIICFSLILTQVASLENRTSTEDDNGRSKKALGIFTVVKFPNSACVGSTGFNGTCYTSEECSSKSGVGAGSCASGFGVCCIFSTSCGSTISENNTYHSISTFSSTTANPCTYKICPCSTNICKLRLDFTALDIAPPYTGETLAIFAAGNTYIDKAWQAGRCIDDAFSITGTSDINLLCGYNTGQHIYVPSLSTCNEMVLNVDSAKTYTRSWNIAVKQIECGAEDARHDCLQYMTGTLGGQFNSFNYKGTDANPLRIGPNTHHLQSQEYDICFRQERDYCAICFSPSIAAESTAAAGSSFGVSGNIVAPAAAAFAQSAIDVQCTGVDVPTGEAEGQMADYITINNGIIPTAIQSSLTSGAQRFCGLQFNGANGAIAVATVCSYRAPFKWGVHFNDQEVWIATAAALKGENFSNAVNFGGLGFWMNWWQKPC